MNWSSHPQLPGPDDDVTIIVDLAGLQRITYDNGDNTVAGLSLHEELQISGGSLTISDGMLLASGSNLSVVGASSRFFVDAATTADGASLFAGEFGNPGTLALPGLTSYTQTRMAFRDAIFQSLGAGSLLDLSALTTITAGSQADADILINADLGGRIDLSGLTNAAPGNRAAGLTLRAVGTASLIDISGLSDFSETGISRIHVGPGSTLLWGNPQSLNRVDLVVGGALATGGLLSLTNGSIRAINGSAAAPNFAALTNANTSHLLAGDPLSRATLALPNLVEYAHNGEAFQGIVFEATGSGSLLDLSSLREILAGSSVEANLTISASQGGRVDLSRLTSIVRRHPQARVTIVASGNGSQIDLSTMTNYEASAVSKVQVDSGSTILWSGPATLDHVDLVVGGTLDTGRMSAFTHARLTATNGGGPSPDFTALTNADASSLIAGDALRAGTLHLPNLTSYAQDRSAFEGATFEAVGAGSVLDLSHLTAIAAGSNNQTQLIINATNGGRVDLSELTSVTRRHQNADVTVTATGSGSEVILSGLAQFGAIRELRAQGGVIRLSPGRAAVDDVEISLIQNGSITAGTIEIFPGSVVRGDGTVTAHLENRGGTIQSGIDAAGSLDVQGKLMQIGGQVLVDEDSTLRVRDGVFIGRESTLLGSGMIEADVDLHGLLGIEATDTLTVTGDMSVGDAARLTIAAGYQQQRGTRTGLFTLLDVTGNLAGEFAIPAAAGAASHIDRGYFLSEKLQDVERLQIDIFAALPGDSDGDGRVGFPDFVRLADNFGTAGDWTRGDFDDDGLIQFPDFVQLADQFGNVSAQDRGLVSIPEPGGGVGWIAVALAALWTRKRRASTA